MDQILSNASLYVELGVGMYSIKYVSLFYLYSQLTIYLVFVYLIYILFLLLLFRIARDQTLWQQLHLKELKLLDAMRLEYDKLYDPPLELEIVSKKK